MMNYLDSDDNNYWYEIAKSIQLYDSLSKYLDLKYESIGKRILKKRDILLPEIYKETELNLENSFKYICSSLFLDIMGFLALDENFLMQELAPEEIDKIEKDSFYLHSKECIESSGEIHPEEIKYLLSFDFSGKMALRYINQLNIQIDRYKARKNISSLLCCKDGSGSGFLRYSIIE